MAGGAPLGLMGTLVGGSGGLMMGFFSSSTLLGGGAGAGAGAVVPFLPFLAEPFLGVVVEVFPVAGFLGAAGGVPASGAVWAPAPRAKQALMATAAKSLRRCMRPPVKN